MLIVYTIRIVIIAMILVEYLGGAVWGDLTDIDRLRATILKDYDPHMRPVQKLNDTTLVNLSFLINGFEINEQRNMITLHLLTVMTWEDQHVKWDPLGYGNLSEITFTDTELWQPEIRAINDFDETEMDHFGDSLIIATPNGEIWWIPPSKFQVHCQFDFRLWPYDTQTCKLILSSWTYHGGEIDWSIRDNATELIIDPTWQDHFTENREWKLVGTSVTRFSKVVYCCPAIPIVELVITVNVQRRSSTHTAAITLVGLGIATAVLISFWLDPFADERQPVTLLILLINSIYLQNLYALIPNNGKTVPLSICFFRDSLIMTTMAFAWTVGMRYMAKTRRRSLVPLPDFIQTFLDSTAATVLCLNPRPLSKGQVQRKLEETSADDGDVSELVQKENSDVQEDWEWLARFLDRIAFFAYLTTYTIFIATFL